MKNLWRKPTIYGAIALGAMTFACQPQDENPSIQNDVVEYVKYQNGDIIPGKYIVRLNPTNINFRKTKDYAADTEAMRKVSSDLLAKYRISAENIEHVYGSSIEGFSVALTDEQLEDLSKDPSVKYIENDRIIGLGRPPGKGPGGNDGGTSGQSTPWGITRVGGGGTYNGNGKAYIIDSGIDSSHEDLNVDASLGFNAFTDGVDADLMFDGNGHGTHVSGTVAAIDNEIGVIGVAPGATVVPVKVLGSDGYGSYAGVIAGINFVTVNASSQNGDVANMSLGGPFSQAVNDAVTALGNADIKVALAAGNESTFAGNRSPASTNGTNIFTISAIDSKDVFASFSNYGNPPVDFAAPGVSVLSTYPGGYATASGTSMASPHVAGLLLLGDITTDGNVKRRDPDKNPDPIAHN